MNLFFGISLSLTAAILPTIFRVGLYLADRYEREPIWLGIVVFLWGAIPAIVASLIGNW
ncbi:MAG: hypothetical protein R2873_13905 [Caldilineaceae bacterium]